MQRNNALLYGAVGAGAILLAGLVYWLAGAAGFVTPRTGEPPTASTPGAPDLTVGRGQPAQREAMSVAGKEEPISQTNERARAHAIMTTSTSLEVTPDQRAKIFELLNNVSHPRVAKADFEMMIGAAVPRQTELAVLPNEVSDTLDGFHQDLFVRVGDTLVLVDHMSWRVVALIPRS